MPSPWDEERRAGACRNLRRLPADRDGQGRIEDLTFEISDNIGGAVWASPAPMPKRGLKGRMGPVRVGERDAAWGHAAYNLEEVQGPKMQTGAKRESTPHPQPQWLPKPVTSQFPDEGRSLRELWSPIEAERVAELSVILACGSRSSGELDI